MFNSTSNNNTFQASTSGPQRPGTPNSSLAAILAQANALPSNGGAAGGASAGGMGFDLPQIRLGMNEIERMSDSVAGRGKGFKGRSRGEG